MEQGYFWNLSFVVGLLILILSGILEFITLVAGGNNRNKIVRISSSITNNSILRKVLYLIIFIWVFLICLTLLVNNSANGFSTQQNAHTTTYHSIQKVSTDNRNVYVVIKQHKKRVTKKITATKRVDSTIGPSFKNKVLHTEISYGPQNTPLSQAFFIPPYANGGGVKHISQIKVFSNKSLNWWHKQKIKIQN
ncbi:hypothetical protein LFYK43_01870 [Ligilactobacillus salitolerans]|uniref:Uncharacterized protein n=1 Tax=Ligilactobacillus salitolerans TaxID=1808352 RepID=A0A401IQB3_9LACO|nr:hypothetical protein [Ligilactobacillus salitolerans]GBG93728.1 hypothetical protein LFYK43_01870 [Ligilactobacillus salitolerans]